MSLFARLLEKMRADPGRRRHAARSRACSCTAPAWATAISTRRSTCRCVLAGGGRGQLKGGRHVRYRENTPFMNLGVTLLDKVGVHGRQDRRQHRPPDRSLRRARLQDMHGMLNALGRRAVVVVVAGRARRPTGARARRPALTLVEAARTGDAPGRRARCCAQKATTSTRPRADGTTALHWAVQRDDAAMAGLLLRAGANVKAANRYGVQPLCAGRRQRQRARCIELLLEAGADPNASVSGGETALMTAARAGKVEALKVLIAHGADVNARDAARADGADVGRRAEQRRRRPRCWSRPAPTSTSGPTIRPTRPRRPQIGRVHQPAADRLHRAAVRRPRGQHRRRAGAARRGRGRQRHAVRRRERAGRRRRQRPLGAGGLAARPRRRSEPRRAGWNALHQTVRSRRPNIGYTPGPVPTGTLDSIDVVKKMIARGRRRQRPDDQERHEGRSAQPPQPPRRDGVLPRRQEHRRRGA